MLVIFPMTSVKVVGCVVWKCDVTVYPPKLSLGLDVAGKAEKMGEAEVRRLGSLVSSVVPTCLLLRTFSFKIGHVQVISYLFVLFVSVLKLWKYC